MERDQLYDGLKEILTYFAERYEMENVGDSNREYVDYETLSVTLSDSREVDLYVRISGRNYHERATYEYPSEDTGWIQVSLIKMIDGDRTEMFRDLTIIYSY